MLVPLSLPHDPGLHCPGPRTSYFGFRGFILGNRHMHTSDRSTIEPFADCCILDKIFERYASQLINMHFLTIGF